ncbi:MAG: transposase [Patescibacteria group bacterium]
MNTTIKPYHFILTKVQFITKQLQLKLTKSTGRPLSISPETIISLGIFWKKQGIKTKKSLHQIFDLSASYKTLTVLLNKFAKETFLVLQILMRLSAKNSHPIKHTDSTDLPVCLNKNAKNHKTLNGLASWGHSGKGLYYGLKMNTTFDLKGKLLGVHFSSASGNDRKIFQIINRDLAGIFIADAGYISKDLAKDFFIENRRILIAKPRANMKKLATKLQNKLYDTRMQIEKHFRVLKEFFLLVSSLPRSVDGYLANYGYTLLAYVLG